MMKTLPAKPLIPTCTSPRSILGSFLPQFTRYVAISSQHRGEFPDRAIAREFGQEEQAVRSGMSESLVALRLHGFYPDGIDDSGNVKWRIALRSEVQDLVESYHPEYDDMPEEALKKICRRGYRQMT